MQKKSIIQRINDYEDLMDILIDVEDYLDSNNIYAFLNWIHGELISGPFVKKYWITISLKWKAHQMPDPRAARRLLAQGTRIEFVKSHEEVSVEVKSPDDYQPGTKKPKLKKVDIWIVKMSIPRRFIENINQQVMDLYDEEIDLDVINDADPAEIDDSQKNTSGSPGPGMPAPGEGELKI